MRRTIGITMAILLTALLAAGCGSGNGNDNGNGNASGSSAPAAETTPASSSSAPSESAASAEPTPEAPSPVKLKLFHGKQEAQETFAALIEKFAAQYPHITIEQEVVTNEPAAVLKARIATNEIPDLFSAGIEVMDIAKAGYLVDLTAEPFLGNLAESSVKSKTFTDADGKTWAMPIDGSSIGIFYNKKIFADLGLSVPRTLGELNATLEALKAGGVTPFALGFKDAWTIKIASVGAFAPAVYGGNLDWDNAKNDGSATFAATPGWTTALKLLQTIYENGNTKTAFDTDYNGAVSLFAKGEAAMLAQGLWALEPIRQIAPDLDVGMMATPVSDNPADAKLHVFPDFSLSISNSSAHIAEAKLFLEFMTRPDNAELWSNKARLFSAVKNVSVNFDPLAGDVNALIAAGQTVSQADRGWPTPFQPEFEKVLPELLLGKKTVEAALAQLDKAWDEAKQAGS